MRIIIDAPDADDQPTPKEVLHVVEVLMERIKVGNEEVVIGVNDAGHGNVLLERLRQAGIPCERWFKASCGLRRKAD